jgi:hypothetical protein
MDTFNSWYSILVIAWLALIGIPFWKIAGRAGHPPALGLLIFVPFANLFFLWWLALGRWPALAPKD